MYSWPPDNWNRRLRRQFHQRRRRVSLVFRAYVAAAFDDESELCRHRLDLYRAEKSALFAWREDVIRRHGLRLQRLYGR